MNAPDRTIWTAYDPETMDGYAFRTEAEAGGLVERLREAAAELPENSPATINYREAATTLEAQAAELAAVKADIETFWKPQFDEQVERAERAEAALVEKEAELAAKDAASTQWRDALDSMHRRALEAELAEVKAYSIEMLHRKDEQFERAERAEAALVEARKALEWYESEAVGAAFAMKDSTDGPPSPDVALAVLTVLALDGGHRARRALTGGQEE